MSGKFVISIDFELIWGMLDQSNREEYKKNIDGGRKAVPLILKLFEQYNIHATWAVVGIMAAENRDELNKYLPNLKPNFRNELLSAYSYFENMGNTEEDDPYCYGYSLIEKIKKTKNQEIATHTFSHYYCDELGADLNSFESDLLSARCIMKDKFHVDVRSIIFPRNHVRQQYVDIAKRLGINCVRTNPNSYKLSHNKVVVWFYRIIRAIDTYFPICGAVCFNETKDSNGMVYTCASRFFRPYCKKIAVFEKIKIIRIKSQMRYAAKNGKTFHLWWHPHNFGKYTDKMINQLEDILDYYSFLEDRYGMKSFNMSELV